MPKHYPYYVYAGYMDYVNHEPYKRAPSGQCPKTPDCQMPKEWREYWDGWDAAGHDAISGIVRMRRVAL